MALINKKEIIYMLAMLATSIFLLGFMYSTMQPLARCSDFNKNSETEFL